MLGIGLSATLCANVFINGVAFLIPTLRTEAGLDLARAGLVSAMPAFGMVLTLIAWGYAVDRLGERLVLAAGSMLTAGAALGAALSHSLATLCLFLVGVAPPLFGAVIGAAGYPLAFAICALFPVLAIPLVPRDSLTSSS